MKRFYLFMFLLSIAHVNIAQVKFTANDVVKPYTGHFGYGSNVGYFPNWSAEQLGDISIGNDAEQIAGTGVTTLRPALFEHFMEQWGYEFRIPTFEHYRKLGAKDNVVFVGYPSEAHRDTTHYCSTKRSELFLNLYEPIWDDGKNGTPYNENNYYAAYLYKTVSLYKEYVKFWEIWNEPDYSFTANSIYSPGTGKNWWEHDPEPCDYDIRAPIQHYIRMLRISYEIIKTVDPEAYVAIGGIGYDSFLDGVLRNTDNPNKGEVNAEFPLKGGAYFDVLSFHTYPHIDNSLRDWSNALGGFVYKRHTDAAVTGVLTLRQRMEDVLFKHGYNGAQYPQKEWIITECNVPRKPLNMGFGSDEVQRNFIIKALVESQKHKIHQFHIFTLGDKFDEKDAKNIYNEYHLMGLYQNLYKANPKTAKPNHIGIAYKTMSDLLYEARFDKELYEKLNLPEGIEGGVFITNQGRIAYVLWATTQKDNSEETLQVINLKRLIGESTLVQKRWNFAITQDSTMVNAENLMLTGEPVFLFSPHKEDESIAPPLMRQQPISVDIYPNPFSLETNVTIQVVEKTTWTIRLINQLGLPVRVLANQTVLEKGYHSWFLNGSDLQPGIYFLEYISNKSSSIQCIQVIKTF